MQINKKYVIVSFNEVSRLRQSGSPSESTNERCESVPSLASTNTRLGINQTVQANKQIHELQQSPAYSESEQKTSPQFLNEFLGTQFIRIGDLKQGKIYGAKS